MIMKDKVRHTGWKAEEKDCSPEHLKQGPGCAKFPEACLSLFLVLRWMGYFLLNSYILLP